MTFLNASDEHLVQQAQLGDREAFYLLYQRYLQRVFNRVKSKVPLQDVEDVTQEIFVAVVRSLDHFEQRSRFNTWLYTIVNRQIAEFYRRRNRSERGEMLDLEDSHTQSLPGLVGDDDEQTDQRLILQRALNHLPIHYQEIILMRFSDGLSFLEIAEQRAQSLEAVKSLYRRAVQAIRVELDQAETE